MAIESLNGKTALVTGAGRGLGRAFALALAAEGMHVGISARTESQLNETAALVSEAGGSSHIAVSDMSEPQSVRDMVKNVTNALGPVHLLINNAGDPGHGRSVWEVDPEVWWHTQTVNVRGPFICSQAVIPGMIHRGSGRIINISSNSAFNPHPFLSAYSTSKAALAMLSRTMSVELQEHGVSVFAYSPGMIQTAMLDYAANSPNMDPAAQAIFRERIEAGTLTPIEHTVSTFMRIARGESDELTGCHIHVNDDIEAMVKQVDEIREKGLFVIRRQP